MIVATITYSHPHVWIESLVEFDGQNLDITWIFDESYSFTIIDDCDKDYDNDFSDGEIANVMQNYFTDLSSYKFFTNCKISNTEIKIEPANFKAWVNQSNNKVYYNFKIDVSASAKSKSRCSIRFYDPSNFISYQLSLRSLVKSYSLIEDVKMDIESASLEFKIK